MGIDKGPWGFKTIMTIKRLAKLPVTLGTPVATLIEPLQYIVWNLSGGLSLPLVSREWRNGVQL